ncbi:MAG: IS3 family transposase [Candidatus Marinimicrobia bacterium]|nr:IS3 family transposase [Candidatus Neomarinimicrobiota bacterium]
MNKKLTRAEQVFLTRTWKASHRLNRCLRVVGLPTSSWYAHRRSQCCGLTAADQWLTDQLVAILGESPAYGWRKLTAAVRARTGQPINHKRVRRALGDQQLQLQHRAIAPPPSPIDQIVHAHRGELNRLSGRTFGPFGLLSGDCT